MRAIRLVARNLNTKKETCYKSISQASKDLGITPLKISGVLKNQTKRVFGSQGEQYEFFCEQALPNVEKSHLEMPSQPEPAPESALKVPAQSSLASGAEKPMRARISVLDWFLPV